MTRTGADDLIDALKDHHARIEQMMTAISTASGHDRVVVFRGLRRFLAAHEAAEELFVHAQAQHMLDDPEVAEHRMAEEQDAAKVLAELEGVDVDSAEFDRTFADFRTSVAKHARAEELRELPEVIGGCSPTDVERMRQALEHVDLIVSRRHGPLGDEDQSFAMMLEAAKTEFRGLRRDLGA